jgi:epoxyqueuosine reductase QueG
MATDAADHSLYEAALARVADIDLLGVAAVADTRGTPLYKSAVSLMPSARSIVVLGMEIFAEVADLVVPDKKMGEAAARDLIGPHYDFLNGRLNRGIYELAKVYRAAGFRCLPLPSQGTPVDGRYLDGLLSFKHAGEYAGLGVIGRSSLLITPAFGPRVRLACLLTDAAIPPGDRLDDNPCAGCGALCVASCPCGALSMPADGQIYAINKYACSAYRSAAGCCVTCLSVCPAGARR